VGVTDDGSLKKKNQQIELLKKKAGQSPNSK
jgi:hypothetical protein